MVAELSLFKSKRAAVVLFLILATSLALRLYGLNWDSGHWLHPDERQIYFVATGLSWPDSLVEALSPESPLNPGFFAYGSFPIYLLKAGAVLMALLWPALEDPDNLHLLGRPLAALFDLGTVYLTYRLTRRLWPSSEAGGERDGRLFGLLAAALAGLAILSVQLSHFYTTDPLLTFFVMLVLNLSLDIVQGGGRWSQVALGLAFGLALATKVSALLLVLVVLAAYGMRSMDGTEQEAGYRTRVWTAVKSILPTLAVAGFVFFIVQPYVLIDWKTFLAHTVRESQIAWGVLDVPYTRQYAGTLPYLYSLRQTALWGLGLPLGLAAWAGIGVALVRWLRRGHSSDALLLLWVGPYLLLTGAFYARYLRYMLPVVPLLCLLAVQLLAGHRVRRTAYAGLGLLIILSSGYLIAFSSIYAEPHSWVTASEWIYREIPAGSTLAVEDWDVALPLPLDVEGQSRRIKEYDVRTLHLYNEPDDGAKWRVLANHLAESDYLIIASRRIYGSIPRSEDRYPLASRYYERLFAGELGFELTHTFTRGPAWLNPRLPPLPDPAPAWLHPDESFVVYDHPRTLILRNVEGLPVDELLQRLQ